MKSTTALKLTIFIKSNIQSYLSPVVFTLFRCLYCHGSNTTEGKLTTRLRISLANFLKFTL